jgi:alginate O-acetyltransferase complex protein AlgI
MLFNSKIFIFAYLPVTVLVFFLLARRSHTIAAVWLGMASVFFYGWWNVRYVPLLLASILFNYAMGNRIIGSTSAERKKWLTILGIGGNLALLGYFKYANFFVGIVEDVTGAQWQLPDIILPLGISFFTFTQIAYLVDAHHGEVRNNRFHHYLLFVTYFPHLIAGPVLHHKQMITQFAGSAMYVPKADNIAAGASIFMIGLIKKLVLADTLALFANPVFHAADAGQTLTFFESWYGALSYTFQLYFDFSGYTDMAIGLSMMLGVTLPRNFNSPYKAFSIIDFWRRWHITLSDFLRDYLYIALGGNRNGPTRRYINLAATMLLGGLWHGANWTFVAWGGLHGLYLIINHGWRVMLRRSGIVVSPPIAAVSRMASFLLTFGCVVIGWVVFRANTFDGARRILSGMSGANGFELPSQILALFPGLAAHMHGSAKMLLLGNGTVMGVFSETMLLLLSLAICWLANNSAQMSERHRLLVIALGSGLMLHALFFTQAPSQFLYFQF